MAPHSGFKLAVIRTMRCDTCNKGNVNGLQECVNCSMHFCRECIEGGKLDNDEKHRMQQDEIANLDWNKPPKGRRAAYHKETTASEPVSQQQREAHRAERRLLRHEARRTETHHEPAPHVQGPQGLRVQHHMGPFLGSGLNVPAGNHGPTGHGHFQHVSAPPGYPPGYVPSLPTHAMPYGVPPYGPGQYGQQGQHPSQGRGLAMPFGPIYGHNVPVNPGLSPAGDPRHHTPPGQQYPHGGYPVPNNFGNYYGGYPLGYTPAPTPQGFAGPGFNQQPSQPQLMYNDRGYVPRGNMPTVQAVSGPSPAHSGHASAQLYGGGVFTHGTPPQEQHQPRGQQGERVHGEQLPHSTEPARETRSGETASHKNAEQPADRWATKRQQQQRAWEQEQERARKAWEQQQTREVWERQQAQQALQQMWERSNKPTMRQNGKPMAQEQQSGERGDDRAQPAVQEASQTLPQAQKQDEHRQERREEQQPQQEVACPLSEGDTVSGPAPIILPPIVAPHVTAPTVTLPPISTSPISAPSFQGPQAPVSAPPPSPRQPGPEPDTTSQLSRLQLEETQVAPNVVAHARRSFGIPALARDLYAGRPNHYDETAARWATLSQSVRTKTIREYDEDDYDDSDDDDATETDPACPRSPSDHQPPPGSRGQKRTRSRASSVDSTLSAELDQQVAAAEVPDTEALRRERAALDMAAAANTLQGGGRGLGGAADAQVVANDCEIRRQQEEVDRKLRREEERRAVEPAKKKARYGGGDEARDDVFGRG